MPTLRKWIKTIMQSLETQGHWSIGVSLDKDLTWIITAAVPVDVFVAAFSLCCLQVTNLVSCSVRVLYLIKCECCYLNTGAHQTSGPN